ncbi:hypothetical protein CORMATOL_02130 [Corynebacterium matruchotii ATCC 33806]|uniref:Uncharacterized protein n=1 Tax=Corynebacterium matruchotii ATCC 33806 TaxID=566549 RepID=C0E554_9CORY|nr:hypothetical protein CORMATOL_02130 [Corynebacterium matruchotii ATCC 33806]
MAKIFPVCGHRFGCLGFYSAHRIPDRQVFFNQAVILFFDHTFPCRSSTTLFELR